MRFIDLFAGLGGFHIALRKLGHSCVFACETDATLRETYKRNFGMTPAGDIRAVDTAEIPPHDILCAGFPCQPFSKAGDQLGIEDPELGDLYVQILRVIYHHHPKYLIIENVPNLEKHDNGQTWERILKLLRNEGYYVSLKKLSPHEFGIPQIRERIYIVGRQEPLNNFTWPEKSTGDVSIEYILDDWPTEAKALPEQVKIILKVWQEFLDMVPSNEKIPHPLWSMEFGATYPYKFKTPWVTKTENLRKYCGSHGVHLSRTLDRNEVFKLLPSHARTKQERFPDWKIKFIGKNRKFYEQHKSWLDNWIPKIREFPSSFQKLEWNCQEKNPSNELRKISEYVIQIRPSGVRVKRRTTAPSLVAMTSTQVPIIAWESRYMTPTECKRLQSMENIGLPESDTKAYQALGNAVSVRVVELIADALVGRATTSNKLKDTLITPHV